MLVYNLRWSLLVLTTMTIPSGEAVEINLLDDFGINEQMDDIILTEGRPYEGKAFLFGDKKDDLLKKGELVNEIAKQVKVYGGLTVSANIKLDANQESTLMWIETIYTHPIFGIWLKCERKDCKLTMLYWHYGRSHEITFDQLGQLDDQRWHKLVVHVTGMKKNLQSAASIYVDCAKRGEKEMPRDYNRLLPFIGKKPITSQMRLAQRSRGRAFEKPWRGSLQNVKLVFNRDIKILTDQTVCLTSRQAEAKQYHPPKETASTNEITSNDKDVKILAGSIEGLEQIMNNQIEETKYLRRLIENFHYAERRQLSSCALKPCYPSVRCTDTPETSPGYKCGHCPIGLEGDGINCTDIDECALNPCFPSVKCENTASGYKCGSCPAGYRGGVVVGVGRDYAKDKQVCIDIDECAESNTACAKFSKCVNTVGSYKCSACANGYTGNPYEECKGVSYCSDDPKTNPCDQNAECIKRHHGRSFQCSCKVGYVGDGLNCGLDKDMDGVPDYALSCTGVHCTKDNCPGRPNPEQSDIDKDGKGDACDDDIDGDGVPNHEDNCPKVANKDQKASDNDSFGDACDNCPLVSNDDQTDSDGVGQGDACDSDMDNDGIINRKDNCPKVRNSKQEDSDRDGVGDKCDNCPRKYNPKQEDVDLDFVGDACDNDVDRDRDGIQDSKDNCPSNANAAQLDNDEDGQGDECDRDDDNDWIIDIHDNCPFISNRHQRYSAAYGRGPVCKHDFDGDRVKDKFDSCPKNAKISSVDFRKHIIFSPDVATRQNEPIWKVEDEGREIHEELQSDPSMLIGNQAFESVEFNGTLFVDTNNGNNMIGFVFGFRSAKSFFVVTWKRQPQKYWNEKPFQATADPGLIIKEVKSSTGPSEALRNALWHSESVHQQTEVLWKDRKQTPWDYRTAYKWVLRLDSSRKRIRLDVFQGAKNIISSPKLYAERFRGGRLGMFTFSQGKVMWTALSVKCL